MQYMLGVNGASPETTQTYVFYVGGGALSYFVIALVSDRIYGRRVKFLPLMVWVVISFVYQSGVLVVSLFLEIEDNIWNELI